MKSKQFPYKNQYKTVCMKNVHLFFQTGVLQGTLEQASTLKGDRQTGGHTADEKVIQIV